MEVVKGGQLSPNRTENSGIQKNKNKTNKQKKPIVHGREKKCVATPRQPAKDVFCTASLLEGFAPTARIVAFPVAKSELLT